MILTSVCKELRRVLRINRNTPPAISVFSTRGSHESRNEDWKRHFCSLGHPNSVGCAPDVEVTKTLLRNYGFTDTQLSKLFTKRPRIFTSVQQKTLLPKLDFFRGIGFSNTDLPRIICENPDLLLRSLQKQLVPCYDFIKGLLLSDDEKLAKTLKRDAGFLILSLEKSIAPNVAALREAGVPQKNVAFLLSRCPSIMRWSLAESVKKATEMGLDPNKLSFVNAVRVFAGMTKSTWDKKMEIYRKCGMSDKEILKAFRSNPLCMHLGEQNIVQTMDFIVTKMGWLPADIACDPTVLLYSLEQRTIPRCTVVRYLQGKGLLRKLFPLGTFLRSDEKIFLDRFVNKYQNDVPGLMDIYLVKIAPQEPRLGSDM